MNISELCIRRPIMTLLLTISLTLFGVQVFRQLPVNDLPAVDSPVIQISVSYPGASPETMANTVATPLEKQFLQIPGLDLVTSTIKPVNLPWSCSSRWIRASAKLRPTCKPRYRELKEFFPTICHNLRHLQRPIRTTSRSSILHWSAIL